MKKSGLLRSRPLVVAAFLLWCLAGPARAEFTVTTELGLGNSYKAGGWTPLRINLKNQSSPLGRDQNFDGQVQVTTVDNNGQSYTFAAPLELPLNGRKMIELPVILPHVLNPVTIQLITNRGRVAFSQQLMPNSFQLNLDDQRQGAIITPTVLLLGTTNDTPSFEATRELSANTRVIQASSMPHDYKSYDGVQLLVIRHAVTGMLELDQIEALDQWLRLGGRMLVIAAKEAADMRQDRWLAPRLPAQLIESREASLKDLDPNGGADKILMAAWGATAPSARIIGNSPAGPLALERPYGMGTVTALSVDPAMLGNMPLRGAIASLMETLVLAAGREDVRARHYWETSNIMPFTDSIRLPSRMIVILLVGAFVIIVGPLNFKFLRARRRLELAWVTIPVLSILFFSAIYAYGVASKGGRQQFGTAEILHLNAGQPDGLLLWNAMQFSPRREVYQLSAGPSSSMAPLLNSYQNPVQDLGYSMGQQFLNATGFDRGTGSGRGSRATFSPDGGYELSQPAGQWEPLYYIGERPTLIKGKIDGDVTLLQNGSIRVRITNGTEAALTNAVVRVGPQRIPIGKLEPGGKFEQVSRPSVVATPRPAGDDQTENMQYRRGYRGQPVPPAATPAEPGLPAWADTIANSQQDVYPNLNLVHPQRRCRLIARQEAWPSDIKVDPTPDWRNNMGLVEVDLPLLVEGQVRIGSNNGLLRREVYHVGYDKTGSINFGEKGNFCDLDAAWVDILFAAPRLGGEAQVAGGVIDIAYEVKGQRARGLVYNYRANQWDPLFPLDGVGGQHSRHILLKPEWVNPWSPMVRVRIEALPVKGGEGIIFRDVSATMDLAQAK
ncbi:hypothetical protein LLG95_04710 [bacterium]|nr:hypothetical protein [bacterium]